jgi:hypothetical protein
MEYGAGMTYSDWLIVVLSLGDEAYAHGEWD